MHSPLWVSDLCEVFWVVVAPVRFSEARVGPQDYPVGDSTDNGILGCALYKLGYEMEHAIGDHFLTFWYIFVFFNRVRHYFNVIYVS